MSLISTVTSVAELGSQDRERMFQLMSQHFEGVERRSFESDLSEKRWVIQLFDEESGELCGFSTQMLLELPFQGRLVHALYSGDTIVDRQHWGSRALANSWGRLALSVIEMFADEEVYWFLICMGYRTYRFLPVYFRQFFPRYDQPTPRRASELLDALALSRFPDRYDRAAGVVRAIPTDYRLREGVGDITEARKRDPHIDFFASRNHGHVRGDELCCLATLHQDNITAAAQRVIAKGHSLHRAPTIVAR